MKRAKGGRLQAFLTIAAANKLWVVATSLVLAALTYLSHCITTIPSERYDSESKLQSFQAQVKELRAGVTVAEQALAATKNYYAVVKRYNDLLAGSSRSDDPRSTISHALHDLRDARHYVNIALGTMQGTRYSDPAVESYRAEFVNDMASMDTSLDGLEALYTGLITCDAPRASEGAEQIGRAAKESESFAERLTAAFEGFLNAEEAAVARAEILSRENEGRRRQTTLQLWIAAICLIAIAIYIVVAIRVIFKRPRKASRAT